MLTLFSYTFALWFFRLCVKPRFTFDNFDKFDKLHVCPQSACKVHNWSLHLRWTLRSSCWYSSYSATSFFFYFLMIIARFLTFSRTRCAGDFLASSFVTGSDLSGTIPFEGSLTLVLVFIIISMIWSKTHEKYPIKSNFSSKSWARDIRRTFTSTASV